MEKKKTKKKWREIRSTVTMLCVMAAMLSTATYAWFTISQTATVTGLEMTAKTEGGLLVSIDQANWSSAVDLRTGGGDMATLTPVSVVTKDLVELNDGSADFYSPQFRMPKYNGVYDVNGLYEITGNGEAINNLLGTADNLGKKAVKKTFYVKDGAGTAMNVGIEIANVADVVTALAAPTQVGLTNGKPNIEGSFVVLNPASGTYTGTDASADDALEAVRVGLVIYNDNGTQTLKIWEPNSDLTKLTTATFATNNAGTAAVTPDVKSNYNGTIDGDADNTSGTLFSLTEGDTDGVRVDVFMWFEGQDDSCVNEIMADTVIAQLKFVEAN